MNVIFMIFRLKVGTLYSAPCVTNVFRFAVVLNFIRPTAQILQMDLSVNKQNRINISTAPFHVGDCCWQTSGCLIIINHDFVCFPGSALKKHNLMWWTNKINLLQLTINNTYSCCSKQRVCTSLCKLHLKPQAYKKKKLTVTYM